MLHTYTLTYTLQKLDEIWSHLGPHSVKRSIVQAHYSAFSCLSFRRNACIWSCKIITAYSILHLIRCSKNSLHIRYQVMIHSDDMCTSKWLWVFNEKKIWMMHGESWMAIASASLDFIQHFAPHCIRDGFSLQCMRLQKLLVQWEAVAEQVIAVLLVILGILALVFRLFTLKMRKNYWNYCNCL